MVEESQKESSGCCVFGVLALSHSFPSVMAKFCSPQTSYADVLTQNTLECKYCR